MRIVIATGIYPPRIGGPAQYALMLSGELRLLGHTVSVCTYGIEEWLPVGIRHIWFFIRIFFALLRNDIVIALDTLSVGAPALFASRMLGKVSYLRVGGDFLWESYVERTGSEISLPDFYIQNPALSLKENIIKWLTNVALTYANVVVYTTHWQQLLWQKSYNISKEKIQIIENVFAPVVPTDGPNVFTVLWAGRSVVLKNVHRLKRAILSLQRDNIQVNLQLLSGVSASEVRDAIGKASIIALPSFSDVSPNIILEGLAQGKPFVMTTHTGVKNALSSCGIFVDPFNEEEIAKAVKSLMDRKTYLEMRSCISMLSPRSQSQVAKEWDDLLRKHSRI